MSNERVDLAEVWRDKVLLEDIRSEVKRQAHDGWRPWELLLPPDLLWPMVTEISEGRCSAWSPVVDGIGVQVGEQNEVAIRFVLPGMHTSPVKVRALPYRPARKDDIVPVEVRHGAAVRV